MKRAIMQTSDRVVQVVLAPTFHEAHARAVGMFDPFALHWEMVATCRAKNQPLSADSQLT